MRDLIAANLGTRLHRWEPLLPGAHLRIIYVEDKLFRRIVDPDPTDYRVGQLWSDLDHFSHGRKLTVGYGPEPTCIMKLLDPRGDEVWELRSKDPEPQIRVFGRFADTDLFVATHAEYRDFLGNPRLPKFDEGNNWPAEIQRCHSIWDQLFQYAKPHSGNNINAYVSANVDEVGRLP